LSSEDADLLAQQELRESRFALRALAQRVQGLRELERSSLARIVHDDLGQILTAMKFAASEILATTRTAESNEQARRLMAMADEAIAIARRISSELRPAVLDELGLEAALEWQLQQFERRTGIKTAFEALAHPEVDEDRRTVCFRIVQEALTNVLRHARAHTVRVVLGVVGEQLTLDVIDDGIGIDPRAAAGQSLGLLGMRERAEVLGGSLTIGPGASAGTRLSLKLPVRR
jgi:signal transduction histidine kinase